MVTRIQFIFFVIIVSTICNTSAQELFLDKYLSNLKKNMEILKKEKDTKPDYDYLDDEYFYDDKEDYEPETEKPPSSSTSGKGPVKPKEPEVVKSESYSTGGAKKYPNTGRKDDIEPSTRPPPAPRPGNRQPVNDGIGQRSGSKSAGAGTLKVLTVKKFMFQAKPVTPHGKKTSETMKIYYTL